MPLAWMRRDGEGQDQRKGGPDGPPSTRLTARPSWLAATKADDATWGLLASKGVYLAFLMPYLITFALDTLLH